MTMIYVFDSVSELTDNWHSEGGLVVVAENRKHAKELIEQDGGCHVAEDEWDYVTAYKLASKRKPCVYVFPDAGCC